MLGALGVHDPDAGVIPNRGAGDVDHLSRLGSVLVMSSLAPVSEPRWRAGAGPPEGRLGAVRPRGSRFRRFPRRLPPPGAMLPGPAERRRAAGEDAADHRVPPITLSATSARELVARSASSVLVDHDA